MSYSEYRITLDVRKTVASVQLNAKKGDVGRMLYITLSDKGKPCEIDEGSYAVFAGVKPDGKLLYNKTTIENNTIIYKMTQQTTAVAGLVECEVKLFDSMSSLLTSPKLTILVDDVVVDDGEISSTDEVTAFAELIFDARSVIDLGNQTIEAANTATQNANTATQSANDAATGANQAAGSANSAAGRAETGATNATKAAEAADTATTNANNAASGARTATEETNTARENLMQSAGDVLTTLSNAVFAPCVENSASGEVVAVADASDLQLRGLTIYGKTTQNGTPSTESPVPLESAGDSGSIGVTVAGSNIMHGYKGAPVDESYGVTISEDAISGDYVLTTTVANNYFKQALWIWPIDQSLIGKEITYSADSISVSNTAFSERVYITSLSNINDTGSALKTTWLTRSKLSSTYVIPDGTSALMVLLRVDQNSQEAVGDTLTIKGLRLNIGKTALPNEPNKGMQTLTIQTPNGLNGIGEVKDVVDCASGVRKHSAYKVVFDGSDDEKWQTNANNHFFILKSDMPYPHKAESKNIRCSHFGQDTNSACVVLGGAYGIQALKTSFTSLEEWKAFLSTQSAAGTPMTVVYELETPIETPIPAEELAQYAALHTNKPNTTIFNDAGAKMEVSYVADTKTFFMNEIAKLTAAILATGANI
jgi:hypothetical protein